MSIRRPPIPPSFKPPLASIPTAPVAPPAPSAAEWQAIAARHKAAKDKLDKFIEDQDKCLWKERVYPVDIVLPLFSGTNNTSGYPVSIGVINIELGSTFYVLGVEASYTVTGTLLEDGVGDNMGGVIYAGSPATLTVPETLRPFIMDYTWTIRDSATDRDWCNVPIPSGVLRTGNRGYFNANAQARVAGGTKVTITVNQTFFDQNSKQSGLYELKSHSLQFVLTGVEVKDGAL